MTQNSLRSQFTLNEIELSDYLAERHMRRGMLHADAVQAADLSVRWSRPTVERIRASVALQEALLSAAVDRACAAWDELTSAETPAAKR